MERKDLVVHCTYSDTTKSLEELITESFALFLQKELFVLAIRQEM